jgi:hypothetical protein
MMRSSHHDFRHRLHRAPSSTLYITSGPNAQSITETSAVITWTLTTGATGQVFYGTTTAYGSSTTAETSTTYSTHVQTITGLTAGVTYHAKVVSTNASGYTVESGDFTFTTTSIPTGTYPTPAALAYSATASLALPAYLVPSTDANHGTEVVRVSEGDRDRNTYSSVAAWNCDETLLLVNYGAGHEEVLNGQTLARLATDVTILAAAFSWSDTDPLTAWRTSSNQIYRLSFTLAGAVVLAQSWTLSDYESVVLGGYQGQQAGDYIPLCYRKSSGQTGFAVWRISTASVMSEVDVGVAASPTVIVNNVGITQGGRVHIQFSATGSGTTQGAWVANDPTDLASRYLLTTASYHWDAGMTVGGHDVIVYVAQSAAGGGAGDCVGYYDLDDSGAWTKLIDYYPGGHVSCRNLSRPGYAYLSNNLAYGTSNYAGRQDIFAIELADPPTLGGSVEYFAKQHTPDPRASYDYDPMAVASPSGGRVFWGTGWDGSSTVHGFVAGMDAIL